MNIGACLLLSLKKNTYVWENGWKSMLVLNKFVFLKIGYFEDKRFIMN